MARIVERDNVMPTAFLGNLVQPALRHPEVKYPQLSTLQRILLTTDGTVTDIVETYAGESVRVVKLFQEIAPTEQEIAWLELGQGHPVLSRKILLQGKVSGDNLLYAESVIVPDRLDEPVRDGLLRCHTPIGHLIIEHRMETFREIMEWGTEMAGPLADYFSIPAAATTIFRTYRIFANRQPIMLITEKFPHSHYRR